MTLAVEVSAELGGLLGSIATKLDNVAAQLERERLKQERLFSAIHPVYIDCPPLGGNGTIDVPDMLGPHDGYYWDVRRLTAASFTAGTVSVYRNVVADSNLMEVFTQAGTFTFGTGAVLLGQRDRLVFVAAGITGTVTISGQALEIEAAWLPQYLL